MTDTTTFSSPQAAPPQHPSDILINLIVAFLAPMFLEAAGGDIAFARLAAMHTVQAYTARNQADLLAVAQIIAYGLAVLGSLSLAMTDGISISMALQLRSNANACTRSAEKNRQALANTPEPDPEPSTASESDLLTSLADTQQRAAEAQARLRPAQSTPPPVSTLQDQQRQAEWAAAMADVAAEFTADLDSLPPSDRKTASRRAALLNTCANELLSGAVPNAPLHETLRQKLAGK